MCANSLAAVFSVADTITTRDSISFKWSRGSDFVAYFLVYGRRILNTRRDIAPGNFTLLANTTYTNFTATSLASGATYEFNIQSVAVNADGDTSVNNEAFFTFQTASVSENANELPPGGTLPDQGGVASQRTCTNWAAWLVISLSLGRPTQSSVCKRAWWLVLRWPWLRCSCSW